MIGLLCAGMLASGCGTMNNTAKGGIIGGTSGTAAGALIGGLVGKGKGAAIGAAVGAVVGTGTGVIIGRKMDKKAEEAAKIEGAEVEKVTDTNGLDESLERPRIRRRKLFAGMQRVARPVQGSERCGL